MAYTLKKSFEYLRNNLWGFTEKVDGTNIRVIVSEEDILYKGKTDDSNIPPFLYAQLTNIFEPLRDKLLADYNGFTFYGEGYGNKIQKAGKLYNTEAQSFALFDVYCNGYWLSRINTEDVAMNLGLELVPFIDTGTLADMVDMVSEGFKSQWGDFIAEGIVAKPLVDMYNRHGERIVTKVKYKDFIH